jgi:hypothetical protein
MLIHVVPQLLLPKFLHDGLDTRVVFVADISTLAIPVTAVTAPVTITDRIPRPIAVIWPSRKLELQFNCTGERVHTTGHGWSSCFPGRRIQAAPFSDRCSRTGFAQTARRERRNSSCRTTSGRFVPSSLAAGRLDMQSACRLRGNGSGPCPGTRGGAGCPQQEHW